MTTTTAEHDGSGTTSTAYAAIVIGAGQAGPGVAAALAADGPVALVEMDRVGGTCLNHGCKPTKALRASAVVAHQARRAAEYGVHTGEVTVDFGFAIDRVHKIIEEEVSGLAGYIEGVDGLELVHGRATLATDPTGAEHVVTVDGRRLTSSQVYLNVGARASVPPMPGLDTVDVLTEVELLDLTELPAHLVIIGGGYLGCEFGQMFRRFGSEVTIVAASGLGGREDPDVGAILSQTFADEGIRVLEARTESVAPADGGVAVTLDDGTTVTGSHLLMAVGRRSNSDLLGDHGIETDDHGFFVTDGRFQTSVPGVRALGDVNGRGAWTHTSYQDSQIMLEPSRTVDGRITTYAMFTDPPLGRVGMNDAQARESGRRVLKAEVPMSGVSRARLEGETTGVMRILVDADSEEVLGATILGLQADDVIQVVGTAMQAGVRYPALRDALPIHPTVAEYIPSILTSLQPLDG
ncbi:Pyruvate/2-oxoglutarate dehydrogenase complex, dihydrolipoamide dehydrogenase (E3) component [Friedmanniella luteola]|uniref:Pyruvate/2-oxoglutarate dehydrogenase complex, dihydrolipoamide dehydrogenase (E3) component n=1 Tax=Friedmanniella luteola TaxID=546871 RepID=A0A1H1ZX86_9ACTN|nr:mercuric reductase [Friedmanniella luteola]SDT38395.1 Pyruvate/2-oxoglutarate dehydrogenase complex, dihydrolipoamide dehydrogenase (E3) component [Friedmanniella luteola]